MMRRSTIVVVFAILIVALAACQKQQPDMGNAGTNAAKTGSSAQAPSWKLTLTTMPDPPVSGQDAVFNVTVAEQSGKPVSGADVKAALLMETMDMGKNEVTLTEKGGGAYEGKGQFTMAGPWKAVVTAAKNGQKMQQTFQVVAHK